MKKLAAENHFPVDDLFALVENEPAFSVGGDGVLLAAMGISVQAVQVAKTIRNQLATR